MKLFTKISFIVAVVALGLGIIGVCAGMAMGADAGDLSEIGIYISPYHQVRVSGVIAEVEEEIREEMDDIHRLDVDVQNAEIYIYSTEEEQIRFDSNRKKAIGRVEGNTLKLEEETFFEETLVLEIYIPEGLLKEIDIEAAAGTVTADRIVADSVSIEVDAASVQIDELQVNQEAKLHVEAGEILVGYYDGPKLDVDCAMGSIMVVCEGNQTDYNYKMECGVGQIALNQERYSGLGEEIHINNGSSKLIKTECDLGEIVLKFPNSL